jgi:hypothetical protein
MLAKLSPSWPHTPGWSPRPVHEHLFSGLVFLTQHHIQVLPPVLIALAKPTVAITFGMDLPVFFPHQLQGQMAMLLQLLMNGFPVWLRSQSLRSGRHGLVSKQLGFQFLFAQALRQRPTDAGCHRPFQILVYRPQSHPATACNLTLPQPQLKP